MVVAQRGLPPVWLMVATLVGGALAAGGANAINMVVDRDIDKLMHRTQNRPLVTGAMTPRAAPWSSPSPSRWRPSSSSGSGSTCSRRCWPSRPPLFYVFVYTLWLKRTSQPEHRDRRRRRRGAGARRLGGGHRQPGLGARGALRHHLHLDAAALLGAGRPLQGGLRGGRRADAAGGRHLESAPPSRSSSTRWSLVGASRSSSGRWPTWASSTWSRPRCSAPGSSPWPSGCGVQADAEGARMQLFSYSITYLTCSSSPWRATSSSTIDRHAAPRRLPRATGPPPRPPRRLRALLDRAWSSQPAPRRLPLRRARHVVRCCGLGSPAGSAGAAVDRPRLHPALARPVAPPVRRSTRWVGTRHRPVVLNSSPPGAALPDRRLPLLASPTRRAGRRGSARCSSSVSTWPIRPPPALAFVQAAGHRPFRWADADLPGHHRASTGSTASPTPSSSTAPGGCVGHAIGAGHRRRAPRLVAPARQPGLSRRRSRAAARGAVIPSGT